MSTAIISDFLTALVSALDASSDLAAFTITDRPGTPASLPFMRIAELVDTPWDTGSSTGAQVTVTLDLASHAGSFSELHSAADAIDHVVATPPALSTSGARIVLCSRSKLRFFHAPSQELERATLTLVAHLDLGSSA